MNKALAFAMTALLLLAGCMDAEDAIDQIDDVVDIVVPGCNNPDAFNYNNSSDNDLACLSQDILTESISSFVLLMDNGPAMGETAGVTQHAVFETEGMDSDEMVDMEMVATMMASPNGSAMSTHITYDNTMTFEQTWWAFPGADDTTTLYVDYNGDAFMMTSAMSYTETLTAWLSDDMDDASTEADDMPLEDYTFYCSNDGEAYANDMGGILCPEGAGEIPMCPDGMPCTCIDVDGSCDDGDDDWGYPGDGDMDAPEIDFTLYDWNSTNFEMSMDLTNSDAMFAFSADVTVEGTTHEIDMTVNELFEVRSMTVNVPEYNEEVTMTLHTDAEVSDMLADGMMTDPATEALPFTLEMQYEDEWSTMASDGDGNPLFATVYMCDFFVSETTLETTSFMDAVLGADLDDGMCDTEADAYTFTSGEAHEVIMDEMLFFEQEEGALLFTASTVFAYAVEWDGMAVNETMCNDEGGSWDTTAETCEIESFMISNQDAAAIEIDGQVIEYQVNATAGVVLFMTHEDMYVCDDGEYVHAGLYNDGYEDCGDGSDETDEGGNGGLEGDFVMVYECMDFVETSLLDGGDAFYDVFDGTNLDSSLCDTEHDGMEYTFTENTPTIPENFSWYDDDMGEPMHMMHDGVDLWTTMEGWTAEGATEEDCTYEGGTYDGTDDTCTMMWEITNVDDMAIELYDANWDEYEFIRYVYDDTTMSGHLMFLEEYYLCLNDELIPTDSVNDGYEDCADGSDESGDTTVEITFICGNGDEIPFSWVNDGMEDCDDGADEQQYDGDGNPVNWYDCENGEEVWIEDVNDGYDDCGDGSDEYGYWDDNGGLEGDFVMVYECMDFVETSLLDSGDAFYDVFDDTNLDSSLCDTEHDGMEYAFTENTPTMPENFSWYDDDMGEPMHMMHDGADLWTTMEGWTAEGASEEDCTYEGGTYDGTDDTCTMMLEITNVDDMAIELYDANWDEYEFIRYVYDATAMSGHLMFLEEYYLCLNDELIPTDSVNDGYEDCADGSDESGDWGGDHFNWWFGSEYDEDTWDMIGFELGVYDESFYLMTTVGFTLSDDSTGDVLDTWTIDPEAFTMNEDDEWVYFLDVDTLMTLYTLEDGTCYTLNAYPMDGDGEWIGGEMWAYFCPGDDPTTGDGDDGFLMVHTNGDFFDFSGDVMDYSIVLTDCDYEYDETTEEYEETCGEDVLSVTVASVLHASETAAETAMEGGAQIVFIDTDGSGTVSDGDMIGIVDGGGAEDYWNTVRLHSASADAYSDENPTLPGFTGVFATLALLGAAFVRRH
jgi:hypothetical protein